MSFQKISLLLSLLMWGQFVYAHNFTIELRGFPSTAEVELNESGYTMRSIAQNKGMTLSGEIPSDGFYSLTQDGTYLGRLFLRQGQKQVVILGPNKEVTFDGDGAQNNQAEQLSQQLLNTLRKNESQVDPRNTDGFIETLLRQADTIDSRINRMNLKDQCFARTLKLDYRLRNIISILQRRNFLRTMFSIDMTIAPERLEFLRTMDFSDKAYNDVSGIQNYLKEHFAAMEYNGFIDCDLNNYIFTRAKVIKDSTLRQNYILSALEAELYGYNQQLGMMIETAKNGYITTDKGCSKLDELMAKFEKKKTQYATLDKGKIAFDFAAVDSAGTMHHLSDYRGSVVVVDVWSTNCMPCIAEIPYLYEMEKQFEGQPVTFISYSVDIDASRWKKFVKERNMHGLQLVDTGAAQSELVKNYLVRGTPRFFVIDPQGNIVDTFAPKPSEQRLAKLINQTLEQ
ncbi:MAG: TlpA disulfide reductase family protein [Mucinivorans sp.]